MQRMTARILDEKTRTEYLHTSIRPILGACFDFLATRGAHQRALIVMSACRWCVLGVDAVRRMENAGGGMGKRSESSNIEWPDVVFPSGLPLSGGLSCIIVHMKQC